MGYLLKENYQIIVTGVGAIVVHQHSVIAMAEEKVNEDNIGFERLDDED